MAVEKTALDGTNAFGSFGPIANASRVTLERTLDQFDETFAALPKLEIRRKLKENIGKAAARIQSFSGEKKA